MRTKAVWIALAICLLAAGVLFLPEVPGALGQDQPAERCRMADAPLQPEEPLEMTRVSVNELFKTVVMEKEVLVCVDADDPADAPSEIDDVETFIEIIERADRERGATLVERRVEVARCEKDFDVGTVRCETRNVRLRTLDDDAPLEGCEPDFENPATPRDPVEMNTVNSGNVVKTIKVEKEILQCPNNQTGELFLFTEIIETRRDVEGRGATFRPVAKRFAGILCLKDEEQADIVRCGRFTPRAVEA
jgi:hypothetical protein